MLAELRKPRPHGGVVAWLELMDDAQLYLSAVTLGEIQADIELTVATRNAADFNALGLEPSDQGHNC